MADNFYYGTGRRKSAVAGLIKNVPNKIINAVTAVLITDGKVCVIINSKLLKSFVSVDNK